MRTGASRRVVDWGHLAFLAFVSAVVLAYLFDARSVSLKLNNLLLVEPAAILALVLVACVLPQCFRRVPLDEADAAANEDRVVDEEDASPRRALLKVAALAALLGVFSSFLEIIGFDVATFLFMVAGLLICGERKWWVLLLFSAAFTLFVVYGYSTLVPYPFPMRIL